MRSIGKRNITKLKAIVAEEYEKGRASYLSPNNIISNIEERVPEDWYDIWESAWSEIERVIDDEFNRLYYAR